MRVEQLAMDFLEQHKNAQVIEVDKETGLPTKAIYDGIDSTGNYRVRPAVFYFDAFLGGAR